MKRILLLFFIFSFYSNILPAQFETWQIGQTTLTGSILVDDLEIPWEILYGPDDHLWVTERQGRVWRINEETGDKQLVLDHVEQVTQDGTEPGMLGMAFHPDFESNQQLFIVYNWTDQNGNRWERLSSFEYLNQELTNENTILDSISGFRIHNGSRLVITPDEKILMTTGDYGQPATALDTNSLNGKLLRLNLDGSIPLDNPFPGSYVYSLGHRNAQGLYLGPNDILYSTEHGPDESDEINILEAGRNYGWPVVQGACDNPAELNYCLDNNVAEPIWEWTPTVAVNDLVYYNHPAVPEFENCLLIAVLGGFRGVPGVYQMQLDESGQNIVSETVHLSFLGRVRDLCVHPKNGSIYIIDNGDRYPGTTPNAIYKYENVGFVNNIDHDLNVPVFIHDVTRNFIRFESQERRFDQYYIFNFTGQKIDSGNIEGRFENINVNYFRQGAYIFQAMGEHNEIFTSKFIIQKD